MTEASEYATLFKDAREAATAIGGGVKGVIGLAGRARDLWLDASFQNVSAVVEDASKTVGLLKGAVAAAELVPSIARRMVGIVEVAKVSVRVPELPASMMASVASAAPIGSAGLGGLVPGLALGVGLLNLGVGVFNAVQIRRVGVQVAVLHDDVTKGFQRIEESLSWQSHQIARLVTGQASMHVRLEQLRQEINQGFDRVVAAVQGSDERQVADTYHEKVGLLTNVYREVLDELAAGAVPSGSDLTQVQHASQSLFAWAAAQLKHLKPGDPARLPYLVAQALATRSRADARAIEAGHPSFSKPVASMLDTISQEVFALCDGRDLYWIGVEVPEIITQYVYLARGLVMGQLSVEHPDGDLVAALGEPWDDGLGPLRGIAGLRRSDEPGWLPLGTLPDLAWFTWWAGVDAETTDLRDVRAVDLSEVARSVGLPGRPERPTRAQVETLLSIALPTYREQALARLMLAFNWSRVPTLVPNMNRETVAVSAGAPSAPVDARGPTSNSTSENGFLEFQPDETIVVAPLPPSSVRTQKVWLWSTVHTPRGSVELKHDGLHEIQVTDDPAHKVSLLIFGDRAVVMANDRNTLFKGNRHWAWRVMTSGESMNIHCQPDSVTAWMRLHLKSTFSKPEAEDRLLFAAYVHRLGGTKTGFTEALYGPPALAAAIKVAGDRKISLGSAQVKYYFTWPYFGHGKTDSGLVLGETSGCIWSPGALWGTDVRGFAYGDSTSVSLSCKLNTLEVGSVCFCSRPDTDEGRMLLSSLAALLASLGLPYVENE